MFVAALFATAKTWKQPKSPSTDNGWRCVTHRQSIKKEWLMTFAATWMDLEIIKLNEVSQTKTNIIWLSLECGI